MTGRINHTPEAEQQLNELDDSIAETASPETARRFVTAILDRGGHRELAGEAGRDVTGVARRPPHYSWHDCGMSRTRLSTTVDADLLESARKASGKPDAALVDEALAALLARHRAAEVDASYAAYDAHPLDEPDEWGDLASFRRAVAAS